MIYLTVSNSSGTKVAEIFDPLYVTGLDAVDENGSFEFAVPLTHPRASVLQKKRTVRAYIYLDGTEYRFAGGVIDSLRYGADKTLVVAGDGLLRELSYTLIRDTEIADDVTVPLTDDSGYEHVSDTGSGYVSSGIIAAGYPYTFTFWASQPTSGNPDYLYVGYYAPFDRWTPVLSTYNTGSAGAVLSAQFFQQVPGTTSKGWASLSITDGTASGGETLAQAGTVSWTRPSTWAPVVHQNRERWWVRFRVSNDTSSIALAAGASIRVRGQDSGDVDNILSLASGWSLNGSYSAATQNGTYWPRIHNVSVLGALYAVAQRAGEHFRLDRTADNSIDWLQDREDASGLIATTLGDPNLIAATADRCWIDSIAIEEDSYDRITRLYAEGAGQEGAALDLSLSTDSVPAGLTVNRSSSYVEVTGASPTIEDVFVARDITSETSRATEPAANELLAATVAELQRRYLDYTSYRLAVIGLTELVPVGETIRVIWSGVTDNGFYVDIDEDLYVTAVTHTYADGELTAQVQVANVARAPITDADILHRRVAQLPHVSGISQALDFERVVNVGRSQG